MNLQWFAYEHCSTPLVTTLVIKVVFLYCVVATVSLFWGQKSVLTSSESDMAPQDQCSYPDQFWLPQISGHQQLDGVIPGMSLI